MKKYTFKKNKLITALAIASMGLSSQFALAQGDATEDGSSDEIETVVVIGSRSHKPRSASDSPVPVDVISADDLSAMGGSVDLTDSLKTMIPSYTATPATGDGSAFVRPTSLRGTAPDQSLVLVNGKRRHRSALVQFFAPAAGNGAHGVDIGMIPTIALKRVEVLRDGASSQYGSDAIAGVMNFVTKDASEGGEFQIQYGQHYDGEQNYKVGINQGFALGDTGFVNISLEYADNEALSRGIIRPDAQALIDAGVVGVGADSPFDDAPFTQTWGRPETEALRFFLNSAVDVGENSLYARFGYGDTFGRYRFFYRNPGHSTLSTLSGLGYTGNLLNVGFTPFLDGDQKDVTFVTGLEGEFSGGTYFDFSFGYGKNELDYFLNNTINAGLGLDSSLNIPQMDFNVGGYQQKEINLNADFSYPISDSINLAYGAEWREETYTAIAGELSSYTNADGTPGAGTSGFRGIPEADADSYDRDNIAVYLDIEHDITDEFLLQYAIRYEDFSDFGSTVNGKLAGRYNISDTTAIRGAISTGFHAPTPGQANVRTTITTFDGATGQQVEEGLIPVTDERAIAVGGKALTEEKSFNVSFGLTSDLSDSTTLTVDFYKISVDDRIYRTGDIQALDGSTISFYTNALDVEHTGVDLVITSSQDWSDTTSTDFSFAYGYNRINVVDQKLVNGITPVSDSAVEDIENNYPNSRFTLAANTLFGEDWNFLVRANFYGEHYDERGTINPAVPEATPENPNPVAPPGSALIGSVIYIDAEVGYWVNEKLRVKLGFSNLFDEFIDKVGPANANRESVGLQYPRRSAANYEGGSWYLGATYSF